MIGSSGNTLLREKSLGFEFGFCQISYSRKESVELSNEFTDSLQESLTDCSTKAFEAVTDTGGVFCFPDNI